jgi:excisionase family DNA binding protein
MDKEASAMYLGISVRSLERYMAQGRVEVRYERSDKTRPKATFAKEELDRFKGELEAPSIRPVVESDASRHAEDEKGAGEGESDRVELRQAPTDLPAAVHSGEPATLVGALVEAIERVMERQGRVIALTPDRKLLLSLREVQSLTGLSRVKLRQAVSEGKLKAQIIGRGWKVKRSELDRYVEREF